MSPSYILLAIPVFFLAMGIEWYIGKRKQRTDIYRINDSVNNLTVGLGQQLWSAVFKFILFGIYVLIYQKLSIFKIPATWWSFAVPYCL